MSGSFLTACNLNSADVMNRFVLRVFECYD
jgi:hypothetical protein